MQRLVVGELYIPGKTSWPEAIDVNPLATGLDVRLFFAKPSPQEIEQIRHGAIEAALTVVSGVPILALRYGNLPWHDCAIDVLAVPAEQRIDVSLSLDEPVSRLLATHLLVDAATGVLHVLRATTLSPTLSRRLLEVWRQQVAKGQQMDVARVERFLAQHPVNDLVAKAEIRERLGSPHTR